MNWNILTKKRGVTLIELLIVLMISSILVAALYTTFIKQQKIYTVQEQVVDMQQCVRIAMDMIVRYVRMAGYDPMKTGNFGFQTTASDGRSTGIYSIAFTVDGNEDGILDNNDSEQIGFRLNGLDLQKYSTSTDHWQTIAGNIEGLSFLYTLNDGTETTSPANPADIRMVKVTIIARTSMIDPELGSGGGYRKRTLESSIKVRNLGL